MASARFLKVLTKLTDELDKERTVLVQDETKKQWLPMRADKVRLIFGPHVTSTKDNDTLTTEFAAAYYKLPLMGRAVLALRYGLFSGVELYASAVQRLIGVDKKEVTFIEERSKQRIYEELGLHVEQAFTRPSYANVTIRKKARRAARDAGFSAATEQTNQLGEALI